MVISSIFDLNRENLAGPVRDFNLTNKNFSLLRSIEQSGETKDINLTHASSLYACTMVCMFEPINIQFIDILDSSKTGKDKQQKWIKSENLKANAFYPLMGLWRPWCNKLACWSRKNVYGLV